MDAQQEIGTVEKRIQELEEEIETAYCRSGRILLQAAETELAKIDRLTLQLIREKKYLQQLKKEQPCPHCQTLNGREDSNCKFCRKTLIEEDPYEKNQSIQ